MAFRIIDELIGNTYSQVTLEVTEIQQVYEWGEIWVPNVTYLTFSREFQSPNQSNVTKSEEIEYSIVPSVGGWGLQDHIIGKFKAKKDDLRKLENTPILAASEHYNSETGVNTLLFKTKNGIVTLQYDAIKIHKPFGVIKRFISGHDRRRNPIDGHWLNPNDKPSYFRLSKKRKS